MSKTLNLFVNEKVMAVKRFYHLDNYYYLIFLIGKGLRTFDEIFQGTIFLQHELVEISSSFNSKEKFKTDYQIKSTIEESIRFGFLTIIDRRYLELTDEGNIFFNLIVERKNIETERILCQKMEKNYGRPSEFINLFFDLNPVGKGLIVFPRPSPSFLGFSTDEIVNDNKLTDYCLACVEYADKEVSKYMSIHIDKEKLYSKLFAMLSSYLAQIVNGKQNVNIPREVKKIMYQFYIDEFWNGKFDIRTFDIWIRRAKELKLLNFSEVFPGINSLILYPISILSERDNINDEFVSMAKTNNSQYLFRYEPRWENFKEMFFKILWDNYIELSRSYKNFFVPVQDLRDIVCFKLQLSEYLFAIFLGNAYNESMNEIIRHFKISLEVDRSPQERSFKNSKRLPILINKVPKNIIGIKMN